MALPSIYGRGLGYPFKITGSRFDQVADEENVKAGMTILLNTSPEEEPFLVKNGIPYGTIAMECIFEPVPVAIDLIRFSVKRCLDTWEPRIVVKTVDAYALNVEGVYQGVQADIVFRYRATSRDDNLVIPYLKSRISNKNRVR